MNIRIRIGEIDYAAAAIKALPLLEASLDERNGAAGKIIAAFSRLPEGLIRDVFDAIPDREKNEIVAAAAAEYQDELLAAVNGLSREYRIGVTLSDLWADRELNVVAEVDSVDYPLLVSRFLTEIREKLLSLGGAAALMRPLIRTASAEQICGLMDRFLGSRKEAFMAALVNQNQPMLTAVIEDQAEKQGIRLKVDTILLEA